MPQPTTFCRSNQIPDEQKCEKVSGKRGNNVPCRDAGIAPTQNSTRNAYGQRFRPSHACKLEITGNVCPCRQRVPQLQAASCRSLAVARLVYMLERCPTTTGPKPEHHISIPASVKSTRSNSASFSSSISQQTSIRQRATDDGRPLVLAITTGPEACGSSDFCEQCCTLCDFCDLHCASCGFRCAFCDLQSTEFTTLCYLLFGCASCDFCDFTLRIL